MMNCKQFRESLDCYLDGELSAEASAAADAHRKECPQCERAVMHLQELKTTVRRTVSIATPPPDLDARIRVAVGSPWTRSLDAMRSFAPKRRSLALAAAAAAVFILAVTVSTRAPIDVGAANAMDRLALRLDETSPVVLEGKILCRDCELEHRYGVKASAKSSATMVPSRPQMGASGTSSSKGPRRNSFTMKACWEGASSCGGACFATRERW